ncbi:MAG: hypothetical protein H7066_18540 [Cytophagaceae bacterium]|nr:hypothetical protein [Gemmatimonadaceae bacterium]
MAIMMTSEAAGLTPDLYKNIAAVIEPRMQVAPGFILHTAHATPDGMRIVEFWESKAESDRFFAQHIRPNLPPGIHPKRKIQELEGMYGSRLNGELGLVAGS